jgi:hypothetical protein
VFDLEHPKNNDRITTKLSALGDSGDYLSKVSSNNNSNNNNNSSNAWQDNESQSSKPIVEGAGAISIICCINCNRTSEIDPQLSLLQSTVRYYIIGRTID